MRMIKRLICAVVGHKPGLNHDGVYIRDGRRFRKPDWLWALSQCGRCWEVYGNRSRRNKDV